MPYIDTNTIHNPATSAVAPAAWGDQVRDNLEFLIDPPVCSVSHNTPEGAADATTVVLSANQESFDNNSFHSTVSNNSRLTIQTAGRYMFAQTTQVSNFATAGYFRLSFRVNGTTSFGAAQTTGVSHATDITRNTGIRLLDLDVGDYVEATCQQEQTTPASEFVQLDEFVAIFLTR